jgi:invasion protein IalB
MSMYKIFKSLAKHSQQASKQTSKQASKQASKYQQWVRVCQRHPLLPQMNFGNHNGRQKMKRRETR